MSEGISADSIRDSLLEHDREFQKLLCMIPAKYYISPPEQSLFEGGSKKKPTKKKMSAEEKRSQKRARFDPDTPHTIPHLQGLNTCSTIASGSTSLTDGNPNSTKLADAPQLSRSQLQAKLQLRIGQLQHSGASSLSMTKTQVDVASSSKDGASGLPVSTKDALLELNRQKRGQMRDRRRRERKETRRREKELKMEQILLAKQRKGLLPKKENGPSGSGNLIKGLDAKSGGSSKKVETASDTRPAASTPKKSKGAAHAVIEEAVTRAAESAKELSTNNAAKSKPDEAMVQTEAGEPDLTFSALAFGTGSSQPSAKRSSKNPSWTSKNPVEAKIAIDRRQAYLDKLTPEARERAEESKKWEKADLQASGIKVMDDPKKLEKALKRQTKEKRKKRDAWNERTKAVEKLQEDKQKKRRDNIEKRKEQIRDKKKGGVKAKGNHKSGGAGKLMKKSVKGF
ncbi:hypothetical protein CROQUDRAFT_666374 [Cronartium quercuum f. sp. fusiforme G11]|uniref:SURF6-domain-containing protein n=1 Tax=Cronartium quercuum f. sp. fusiforme G11 TaxID=708437 RepID=A0A9P6T6K9_9BASI|nr:hypothetical protein CROQUDRAFT_666374 [Cronartium quercuum f. sp. fusiforme G11]